MEAYHDPRYQMWCRLIPGYQVMGGSRRQSAKIAYAQSIGLRLFSQVEPQEEDYRMIRKEQILEGCNCSECSQAREYYNCNLAKNYCQPKENTMTTLNVVASAAQSPAQTLEQGAREYLRNRLSKTYWTKTEDLRPAFGLEDDSPPKTPKEVIERITSGMYVLPEDSEDDSPGDLGESWYQPWNAIRWRDPAKKKDRDGYNLALKTLAKDRDAAQDIIMTSDGKAGLEALQTFESTAIH
jgi:hypothetical protein